MAGLQKYSRDKGEVGQAVHREARPAPVHFVFPDTFTHAPVMSFKTTRMSNLRGKERRMKRRKVKEGEKE